MTPGAVGASPRLALIALSLLPAAPLAAAPLSCGAGLALGATDCGAPPVVPVAYTGLPVPRVNCRMLRLAVAPPVTWALKPTFT